MLCHAFQLSLAPPRCQANATKENRREMNLDGLKKRTNLKQTTTLADERLLGSSAMPPALAILLLSAQ